MAEFFMTLEEAARIIAYHHFDRKQWVGYAPKELATSFLVDQNWKHFIPEAKEIIQTMEKRLG